MFKYSDKQQLRRLEERCQLCQRDPVMTKVGVEDEVVMGLVGDVRGRDFTLNWK